MYLNWILQRAYLTPLRNGLTYNGQTWTFQELNDLSLKRARQLTALDIKQGDRIAIMGPSKPSLVIMMYACMHLQCEMVMLNRRLTQDEIAYQLEDSKAMAVLIADEDVGKLPSHTSYYLFSTIEKVQKRLLILRKNGL